MERHRGGDRPGDREQHVDVLDPGDDERLVRLRGAPEGGLGGARGYARRRLAGDGVRDPYRDGDEGHDDDQRDHTPAANLRRRRA